MKIKIASFVFLALMIVLLVWNKEGPEDQVIASSPNTPVPRQQSSSPVPALEEERISEDMSPSIETLEDTETMRAVLPEDNEEHLKLAQDLEQLEKVFDDVEERWNKQMRDLLISEFGLGEEEYKTYQQLREEYDMAKLEAFETYHQRLEETHGEDALYRITLAEEEFQAPIQSEYEAKMQKIFGDDLFQRYLGVRDQFNNDLRADAETQLPLFFIDL